MITRVAERSSFVNSGRVVRKGCSLFILIKNLRGEYNFTEKKAYRWEGLSLKEMNAFGSNTTKTGVSAEYTKFIGMIKDGKAIGESLQESIRNAISEFSKSNHAIADFLKERNDIMGVLTEQITDEEKEDLRVQAEVGYAVEKTTKEVTRKAIKESYEMLLDSGISKSRAINIISKKERYACS